MYLTSGADPNWRVRPTGNTVKEPIVGEFDLTAFRFVGYGRLTPRLATFHNKATFDKLVDTIRTWRQFDQNTPY